MRKIKYPSLPETVHEIDSQKPIELGALTTEEVKDVLQQYSKAFRLQVKFSREGREQKFRREHCAKGINRGSR